MPSELILQLQKNDTDFDTKKFSNFPSSKSAYIALTYADNQASKDLAIKLEQAFIEAIEKLDSVPSVPDQDEIKSLGKCSAAKLKENVRLVVIVSDGNSGNLANSEIKKWHHTILPVLEYGKSFLFEKPVNKKNAVFYRKEIKEIIPAIMRITGISDDDQKIFISYRRTDTSEFAEQLFDRLSHEGFEVFLDRFSIEPAVNFQKRLSQELADKAMVLLLESGNYQKSKWIQYEIDFAKKYRLGVYAFNIDNSPKTKSVHDDYRKNISLPISQTMDDDKMHELINIIKVQHAVALYRKRYNLYNNVHTALTQANALPETDREGFINVKDKKNNVQYKIYAIARPAKVNDYHFSDISANKNIGIIIGPEFIEGKRDVINQWLANKSAILFYNEAQILDLCDRVHP